ncbi:archaeal adenylate kinase [Cenarchaeum symbiosum A]|uniref:Adenylate kinase n=1 Tax=Cenarchaeum symbiosum (strain A) TaxID=414004 RepID=A0RUE3_CENSY|nr:archaeal adenylate kinase [Cenarchaeum symbiosum A]
MGKSTLVSKLVEILKENGRTVNVVSFGTVMFDEARKRGVTDRDKLRKLPMSEQQDLQRTAADSIARLTEDYVIVDTHAFISTPSGYYPGLPEHVLKAIRPSNFISVYARPEDIYNRRLQDDTRSRDKVTLDGIKKELNFHQSMISTCSVISGSPVKAVQNAEGKVELAAQKAIDAIGL